LATPGEIPQYMGQIFYFIIRLDQIPQHGLQYPTIAIVFHFNSGVQAYINLEFNDSAISFGRSDGDFTLLL